MTEAPEGTGQAQAPENQGQAWYNGADDETIGYIQNKGWDDPMKAVTSYQELEKFRGASEKELLKLPKDIEQEGALDEIYTRLGRPESVDKYEIEIPDGAEVDNDRLTGAKELAYKLGLNNKQLSALIQYDMKYSQDYVANLQAEMAKSQEAEYQSLIKEWGSNAVEREELSRRGLKAVLPEGANKAELAAKIEGAIGTANTLKMFANVGDRLVKEHAIHEQNGDRPFGYTKEQAAADKKSLMSEISADPQRLNAYNQGKGADYDKMQRILKVL